MTYKWRTPIAEPTIPQQATKTRPLGLAKGKFTISADFFKPLPEDILRFTTPSPLILYK